MQSQKDGYRSRASYKLLEIVEKTRLIRPGMTVVDLGSTPGGWSQVAARMVDEEAKVVAGVVTEVVTGVVSEEAKVAPQLEKGKGEPRPSPRPSLGTRRRGCRRPRARDRTRRGEEPSSR